MSMRARAASRPDPWRKQPAAGDDDEPDAGAGKEAGHQGQRSLDRSPPPPLLLGHELGSAGIRGVRREPAPECRRSGASTAWQGNIPMLTIGKPGGAACVKVLTIRYHEQIGRLPELECSEATSAFMARRRSFAVRTAAVTRARARHGLRSDVCRPDRRGTRQDRRRWPAGRTQDLRASCLAVLRSTRRPDWRHRRAHLLWSSRPGPFASSASP